jgi:hypothetical protein
MPRLTNVVPDQNGGFALPLIRVPQGRPLVAVVTSGDLIGCDTHYYGGRTVPCESPVCAACTDGVSFRWHAYLGMFNPSNGHQAILELTAYGARQLLPYREAYRTLRGCCLRAQRNGTRSNGRVLLSCRPADLAHVQLPEPPDILKCLASIWNVPLSSLTYDRQRFTIPDITLDPEPLNRQRGFMPSKPNGDQ